MSILRRMLAMGALGGGPGGIQAASAGPVMRLAILIAISLTGCATSRDLATASRTVQIREELVGGKLVKLRTVTTTNASEQESATTALDGALIGAQISEAVGAAVKAAVPGVDWTSALASGGALATAAASGYLAVKKREQLRKGRA